MRTKVISIKEDESISKARLKKFQKTSPAGLGIAKNSKRIFPYVFGTESDQTTNAFGFPHAKCEDFVCMDGIMSAGTVGKLLEIEDVSHTIMNSRPGNHISAKIQMISGKIESTWLYGVATITEEQIKEVVSYYVDEENRLERVKENFGLID